MLARIALPFIALLCTVFAAPSSLKLQRKGLRFDYQNDKIRGVNIGGWLVLEPYITPSLFQQWAPGTEPVDEWHYTQYLGKEVAADRLETHWKTFYTEDDFKKIASLGLNTVRIPIGYWAFHLVENDPYVQGQEAYLDQALEWARKHGLYAWVDLHGAPGSQNGFDNSGLRDSYDFQKGDNVQITLDVLNYISKKYGAADYEDVVMGIELLNEPMGSVLNMDGVKDFFTKGYNQLRADGLTNAVVIHDAFEPVGYWDDFLVVGEAWDVVVDHHYYECFSNEDLHKTIDEHIKTVCELGAGGKKESHWNVVGEFTAALTDCALWVNGLGYGARYSGDYDDGTYIDSCVPYIDVGKWCSTYRENVIRFVEVQFDSYELAAGWFFWCWKT